MNTLQQTGPAQEKPFFCSSCGQKTVLSRDGEYWLCHKCKKRYRRKQDPQKTNKNQSYTPQNANIPPTREGQGTQPGSNAAVGALICGIMSLIFVFVGSLSIVGVIMGIIGVSLSAAAKKRGDRSGTRVGGLVTSIIGLIICSIEL